MIRMIPERVNVGLRQPTLTSQQQQQERVRTVMRFALLTMTVRSGDQPPLTSGLELS